MTDTACEMMWLKNLLLEFGFRQLELMPMFYDNQSAIYIAQNLVFYENNHISGQRCMDQEGDFFTIYSVFKVVDNLLIKTNSSKVFSILCSKLRGSVSIGLSGYWAIGLDQIAHTHHLYYIYLFAQMKQLIFGLLTVSSFVKLLISNYNSLVFGYRSTTILLYHNVSCYVLAFLLSESYSTMF